VSWYEASVERPNRTSDTLIGSCDPTSDCVLFDTTPSLRRDGRAPKSVRTEILGVGTANLVLLLVFAIVDGLLREFGPIFYVKYALLVVFGLVAVHGAYFVRRLVGLAEAERFAGNAEVARTFAEERRALHRLSLRVSQVDVLVSGTILALAINV
jgi:hypothetical protein